MFDRQRSSKAQLQRKVASKTREQLETDASLKEVCTVAVECTRRKVLLALSGAACCTGKIARASQHDEQGEG